MKNIKKYNTYIFISTFTRNIIDVYSVIELYKKGFSIKTIIAIYTIVYFLGASISKISIQIGNKIGYKYILIFSSIISGITFYIINQSNNIYILSIFISLSMFTYHPIKHLYGLKVLKHQKQIASTLILSYIATLLSSIIVIKKIKTIYLIIIAIIGILPAIFIKKEPEVKIVYPKHIKTTKIDFFIFDQFKLIFLLLEPLYLYIISNNISYVGTFNIILTISSIICIYVLTRKININKKYKYLNILFVIVLILKLSIHNKKILLVLAFFEGIGIKINELISTTNLYDNQKLNEGYLIINEKIFCLMRALILSTIYILSINLKNSLYILIIGIFILSFKYKKTN